MGARKLCKLPAHVASTTCARMDATTLQELHLIALLPLSLETVPKEDSSVGGSECFDEESELGNDIL